VAVEADSTRRESKLPKYAAYALAGLAVPLAALARSGAPDSGVSLLGFLAGGLLFALFGVLPGYALLRAAGAGRGSWVDWLAPSFVVSMMVLCLWSIPGYMFGLSLTATAACVLAVAAAGFAASLVLRRAKPAEPFCPPGAGAWPGVLDIVVMLVMALTAFTSLRAFSPGADLWFHAGGVTRLVRTGALTTADPFHGSAEPHPMYIMNLWYVLQALLCRFGGVSSVDAVRILPAFMVPVVVSAQACLLKLFFERGRERALGLVVFLVFYTFVSASMEGSSEPSMWREFAGPRWVALFAIYPVALAWAGHWILEGGWVRALAAAAANGMALFVHPQGGQFLAYALLFLLLAGLLWRDRKWTLRAIGALGLALLFVAPFALCRFALLGSVTGQEGGVSALADEGAENLGTLAGVLSSKYFARASELVGSPFWFLGLAAVPLWWREARESGRSRALLFVLGPALVLPLLPLAMLLPVGVHPNLMFRSVWAAPAWAATAVAISRFVWRDETERRPGNWGWAWLAAAGLTLIAAHVWPPPRFKQWWLAEPLLALGALGALGCACTAWRSPGNRRRRAFWSLPAVAVAIVLCILAMMARGARDQRADFARQLGNRALARLAAEAGKEPVIAGTVLSSHLTALTGCHVLGAHKVSYTEYRLEHQRMQADLLAVLKCERGLGEMIEILRRRKVRYLCLFPGKSRSLADRLARHPAMFPVVEEHRGITLYEARLSEAVRGAEAERLVGLARSARPEAARALLAEALAVGGSEAVPAELRSSVETKLGSLRTAALAGLGDPSAEALRAAADLWVREDELDAARRRAADGLLKSGRLREERPSLKGLRLVVEPDPKDARRDRSAMARPLPVGWSGANEPSLRVGLPRPRIVGSITVKVRASLPRRLPELVRLVLHRKGRPPVTLLMNRVDPDRAGRTAQYRVSGPLLAAEAVELRFFSERGHTIRVRELEVGLLGAPGAGED
jgi:hypothetical protein